MEPGGAATVAKVIAAMRRMPMRSWELGVAAQALAAWGDWDGARQICVEALQRQGSDGRLGLWDAQDKGSADPAACGLALLECGRYFGEQALLSGAAAMGAYLERAAPRAPDGTLYHFHGGKECWIDSLYMAPPLLAALGRHEDAWAQVQGLRRRLWDEKAGLYHHIFDDAPGVLKREAHWGVGNGWAAAGLARLIRQWPQGSRRRELIQLSVTLLKGLLRWRRQDGLFHDVVDDPRTFVETNLSQILAASIFSGLQDGWLDGAWVLEARSLREAALAKVDASGLVQGVCGAPNFDAPGTAVEGQAFCLNMEAGYRTLNERI